MQGLDLARRVGAVAKQNQDALIFRVAAQAFDSQADGIADGCFFAGQANSGLLQQGVDSFTVEGKRGLQIGAVSEQYQADAIPCPAFDELSGHELGRRQAVHCPSV